MHERVANIVEAVTDKAHQFVGGLAVTGAFMLSGGQAEAGVEHSPDATGAKQHLIQPNALPGHNIGVPAWAISRLANATVKIGIDYKPIPQYSPYAIAPYYTPPPEPWCSGTKVGQYLVRMNAHCVKELTGVDNGLLSPQDFPSKGALDFSNRMNNSAFGIEDPTLPSEERQTLATANGIAVSTRATDDTLLRVTPNQLTVSKTGKTPRAFNQFYTLPYMQQPHLTPGQEVESIGAPESTDNMAIKEKGIYLGIYNKPTYLWGRGVPTTEPVYIVITNPKNPGEDAGYFGASGSSFVAMETRTSTSTKPGHKMRVIKTGRMAVSGGLSARINSRYDPKLTPAIYNSDSKIQLAQNRALEDEWRKEVEVALGVAIPRNDTILEYTFESTSDKASLLHAFGHYAPASKGGGNVQVTKARDVSSATAVKALGALPVG